MTAPSAGQGEPIRTYRGISIRNIWVLLLYASELFSEVEHLRKKLGREETPDDLLEIVAEILARFVREHLLRGLTRASMVREDDLRRVRGSIDMLRTKRRLLLAKGFVACRFHEPTLNTPRNRLIRAALEKAAHLKTNNPIRKKCRDYATLLFRMGVVGDLPDRATLSKEVYGVNDKGDRQAVAAAKLILDMAMPDDRAGNEPLLSPESSDHWLRRLFEHAVRGFYYVTASAHWHVEKRNIQQKWLVDEWSGDTERYLPHMALDVVLTSKDRQKKIIIDTKFTSLLKHGWYRDKSFSSAHIYQMYAYLRSQEDRGGMHRSATGILLHPATDKSEKFTVDMQGHTFIFATVNLNAPAKEIREELLGFLPTQGNTKSAGG